MSELRTRGGSKTVAGLGAAALIAAAALATGVSASGASAAGTTSTYLVVYKEKASTSGAASAVTAAGGTVVATYGAISVVVARSSNADFATKMNKVSGVVGAVATTRFGSALDGGAVSAADDSAVTPTAAPSVLGDSLSGL